MTNSETKNFSQNVSSSYHLGGKCSDECKKDSLNVPKLRFKGYNEEWKQNKLGNLFEIKAGGDIDNKKLSKNKNEQYKYPVYANALQNNGLYGYSDIYKISGETITVTGRGDVGHAIARKENYYPIVRLLILKPIVKQDVDFWANAINNTRIFVESTGVPQLTAPQLAKIKIYYPSLPEQEKIAEFLTLIDKKIEKQKELVELLKKYKRGLLSQIFSQKLRFKDDNGNYYPNWEECRFDEIFQILGNNTLSRECLNYTNVGVKNIHYGDILVKYNTCINDEIDKIPNINSDINLNKISDDNYLKVGDVILADTAEDYTVGKACEIVSCKAKILSGLHTIPCRPKQYFAKGYLGYYLNSTEYHDKLIPLITGIKVSAISKKEIKKTIIKYPIYKEQEKIANLLLLIENKLNSNIKKLELFATYKKGLLQQLFI